VQNKMNKKGLFGILFIVLILIAMAFGIYLMQVGYFKPAKTACEELGYTDGVFNHNGANINCYTVPYEIECTRNIKEGLVCER